MHPTPGQLHQTAEGTSPSNSSRYLSLLQASIRLPLTPPLRDLSNQRILSTMRRTVARF